MQAQNEPTSNWHRVEETLEREHQIAYLLRTVKI